MAASTEDGEFRELSTMSTRRRAYPVLTHFHRTLTREAYLESLQDMRSEGYRMFATFDASELVAVAGVAIRTNFFEGRHLFVYDPAVRASRRSEGRGSRLVGYLERWALERGCETPSLETSRCREDAHRFFEDRTGMDQVNYSFRKLLEESGVSS